MDETPSFDAVAAFVRQFAGLRQKHVVEPSTRCDADLGITGDDGDDLLKEASSYFRVQLAHPVEGYRKTLGLAADEYLFHSEGLDLLGVSAIIRWLQKESLPRVRDLTVGELHNAIVRAKSAVP